MSLGRSKCQILVWSTLLACVPTTTHHDCAILGATGNDVVIVRAPGNVQYGGCVATDRGRILVHTSSLEGTTGPLRKVLSPAQPPHPFRGREEGPGSWEAEQGLGWEGLVLCPKPES